MKKVTAMVISLGLVLSLAACGGSTSAPASTTAAAAAPTTASAAPATEAATQPASTSSNVKTLKVSHSYTQTHPYHIALTEFKKEVEEKTNGSVVVDIISDAAMGTEQDEIEAVISGTLDASVVAALAMWQNWSPLAAVEEVPFLFPSYEEARAAMHGDFGKAVIEKVIEAQNVKCLGIYEFGYRHITNSKHPIVVPDDLKGLKFRVGPSDIRFQTFETMGASPMSIAFAELFTALQQGTVDGQENPITTIYSSSFYECNKYISLSGHVYNSGFFIINPNYFEGLTAEEQKIVSDAADRCGYICEQQVDEGEKKALEAMKAEGAEINEVDKAAFSAAAQPVWDTFREQYGEEASELLDLALSYVK